MQKNIIPAPTSKLSFKVQFFAETYFRVFKSFAKIAKIRSSRKISAYTVLKIAAFYLHVGYKRRIYEISIYEIFRFEIDQKLLYELKINLIKAKW